MFKNAGISVLLDFHAAPGAQTAAQTFTGHCVNSPGFFTQANASEVLELVHYPVLTNTYSSTASPQQR